MYPTGTAVGVSSEWTCTSVPRDLRRRPRRPPDVGEVPLLGVSWVVQRSAEPSSPNVLRDITHASVEYEPGGVLKLMNAGAGCLVV